MSELSFLLDLLLNEKLSKAVKDKVSARIKEVETTMQTIPQVQHQPQNRQMSAPAAIVNGAPQSASFIASLKRSEAGLPPSDMGAPLTPEQLSVAQAQPPPVNSGQLVATPAAAQAVRDRQQMINAAINGKPMPGESTPPKFRGSL